MAITQQTKPAARPMPSKPTSGRPTPNAGGAVVGNSGGLPAIGGKPSQLGQRNPAMGGVAVNPGASQGGKIPIPPGTPPGVAALAQNPAFQQHVLQGKPPQAFGGAGMQGGPGMAPDQGGYGPAGPTGGAQDPMSKPMPMGPSQGGTISTTTPPTPFTNHVPQQPPQASQPGADLAANFPVTPTFGGGDTTGQGMVSSMGDQGNQQQLSGLFQDPGVLAQVRQNLQMARAGGAGGQMRPQGWVPGQAY